MQDPDPQSIRAELEGSVGGVVYLDHALRGPVPERARRAAGVALEQSALGSLDRPRQRSAMEETRRRLAKLLGWPASSVAFTLNTTQAIGSLAQAVDWRPGDRVLVHSDEEPSNLLPWFSLIDSAGITVEALPSRDGRLVIGDLKRSLRENPVRVIAVAAVALATGQRRNLAELGRLAKAHGALLFIDAAQALGCLTMDLSAVDALCGCGRKWLLGPPEVGILALRPGLAEELRVPAPGSLSREADGSWREGALRFEGGALPSVAIEGLGASLTLHEELGLEWIEERVLALASEITERAMQVGLPVRSPLGLEQSGVVHLELPRVLPDLEDRLRQRRIVVRVAADDLRVSPSFWNDSRDLAALFDALDAALR